MRKTISSLLILSGISTVALLAAPAAAQNFVKIENRQFGELQINVEKGPVAATPALNGWWSADWVFEPIKAPDGTAAYRIKNRHTGVYLNTEVKPLQATNIHAGAWSSYWTAVPTGDGYYRLHNYYTKTFLTADNGRLTATDERHGDPVKARVEHWKLIGLNGPEPVTQCVKNVFGTGIVARVKWYDPEVVSYVAGDPLGDNVNTRDVDEAMPRLQFGADGRATPVRSDVIALGQESCHAITRPAKRPHFAIVSVEGGKFAAGAVSIGLTTGIALAGIAACAPTLGAGCAAAAGAVASIGSGGVSIATLGLPDAKEVFFVGVPGRLEVKGTVFAPVSNDVAPIDTRSSLVRQRDATDTIKAAFVGEVVEQGQRGIKFNNQAGYAASMTVTYFVNKTLNGVQVPLAESQTTEKITAGFVRTVIVPNTTAPGFPINVTITGVATVSNPAYSTTVDAGFTGEKCFKSYGSLFNPAGGTC